MTGGYTTNFQDEMSMPEERPKGLTSGVVKNALVINKAKNVNQLFKQIPEAINMGKGPKMARIEDNNLKSIIKRSLIEAKKETPKNSNRVITKINSSKKILAYKPINSSSLSRNI